MSYSISRSHEIHCGHKVTGHESKCAHLHGHSYRFDFTVSPDRSGGLDNIGRVIDFSVVRDRLCLWLELNWDHRMLIYDRDQDAKALKDIDPLVVLTPFNPTAENIAQHLVSVIGPQVLLGTAVRLVRCVVHETSKCSATYESTYQ